LTSRSPAESIEHGSATLQAPGWASILVVLVLLGSMAVVFWAAVDRDLLTRRSSRFSVERFSSVTVGAPIEDVISLLGPPISSDLMPNGEGVSDPGTVIYYFMGDAPGWWPFYTEAMVVTDDEGRVVRTLLHREP